MSHFDPAMALLRFLGFFIALTMHEAGKAIVAKRLGDKSLETSSRATLNPMVHIDLFGTIIMPAFLIFMGVPYVFGWAKRLEISSRYFNKIKRDINIAYSSGTVINFIIALLCVIGIKMSSNFGNDPFLGLTLLFQHKITTLSNMDVINVLLYTVAVSNIVIGIINLLPFIGSAGWYLLMNNLKYDWTLKLQKHATLIHYATLFLLLFGFFNKIFNLIISLFFLIV